MIKLSEIEKYYNGEIHVDFDDEIEECKECGNKEIYQDNLCFKCFGEQLFSGLGEKSKEQQLQEENKRLHSIIKEVREYVEKYEVINGYYDSNYDGENDTYSQDIVKEDILEILDKENK